jgi:hypothetical protein
MVVTLNTEAGDRDLCYNQGRIEEDINSVNYLGI